MIKYSIPGLIDHFQLNINTLSCFELYPQWFYPNVQIEAVYGVFPHCIFDGGRVFNRNLQVSLELVQSTIEKYNQYNVSVRLVYTNSQLKQEHYTNHFGNLCLEECNKNKNNQVVIADESFLTYIQEHYSNLSFISSTTKCLSKEDSLNELKKSYYKEVCLDYNFNNTSFLKTIPKEYYNKCEFLANAICPPGCAYRQYHYKLNSLYNLQYNRIYEIPYCNIEHQPIHPIAKQYSNTITYEMIKNNYEPLGFEHFKLEGRTLTDLIEAIIYSEYMVLPQYRDIFITTILEKY